MDEKTDKMTYEEKEKRLDEILKRLDNSETPVDQLASEAKEAAARGASWSYRRPGTATTLTALRGRLVSLRRVPFIS